MNFWEEKLLCVMIVEVCDYPFVRAHQTRPCKDVNFAVHRFKNKLERKALRL